jgi:L-asparaginase II
VGRAGDAELVAHWRSCAKPFQAMPLLASGAPDALGWGDEQIAVACASHGGEPEHLAVVGRMLEKLELDESALACGAHTPLTARGARLLAESVGKPSRKQYNCSGKHTGMLALARQRGWPLKGYQADGHPVQDACLATVAEWSGVPVNLIGKGIDGCGVTTFALPLVAMARAFSRLAVAFGEGESDAARIVRAMTRNPFLVGGTERFDTVLMAEADGRILAKVGAEGVHTVALLDSGVAFAVKAEDGAQRAQYPAVVRLLRQLGALGALDQDLSPALARFEEEPLFNTRGERVGEVVCVN